jgi:hypothetical protein
MHPTRELDQCLLDLAWSLWTELGIAGTKRNHKKVLILVEELVLFTSVLAEIDPRLRDEVLDWCCKYHRFISVSRLKSLLKDFEELVKVPFSKFAATFNELSGESWPVPDEAIPGKISPLSGKSNLRPHESEALLNIRARSIFGTGARADVITFFLVNSNRDFSVAEAGEIGYSKRNLAEVLDDLRFGNLFGMVMQGNQQRYRLNKNSHLFDILKPIPSSAPSWRLIFSILLSLRNCILKTKDYSESSQGIEIQNCLREFEGSFQKLGVIPPSFQNNFTTYLDAFNSWLLQWAKML